MIAEKLKKMKYLIAVLLTLGLFSCKKATPLPGRVMLLSPLSAAACTTGKKVSATESTVFFTWSFASHTDTYIVYIKNLLTNMITTRQTLTDTISIRLLVNTPYSWYVQSSQAESTSTSKSDTWKFYNAGSGSLSYPPFPATIASPGFGQRLTATNNSVTLAWAGSSASNNIAGYDVYIGTSSTPVLYKSGVTDTSITGVPVVSGSVYYWKIITRDQLGNTSDSGVSEFMVN